ncbi:AfsR/SARP family transcriptional regulator [Streptomyces sp. NBC_01262]|uniref:AfsR/SARP family transcriptional regulator n=1 Tax=Streptomyces sp. NBC_01262 TaxID=2903803 RepID=UPI002E3625AD|nr:BTAD domain-containing putative transcriptional regulator [Streptomyces sp. NBC_01262]
MRYLILGATEARSATGTPIPLGGTRLRALLTALALRAPHAVSAETLIDEVWGGPDDEPPHDAPGALQALVSRLRRALGKDAVTSGPAGYCLDAQPCDIDLRLFERLVREGTAALDTAGDPAAAATALHDALALWRGPALADLPDRGSAAARPEALRVTALQRRIDADLALGRADDVLPQLRELVAEQPLHEPFHGQLIRALRATGRTADALMAYEEARAALAEHLGTDPGPELRGLHAQLLSAAEEPQPQPSQPQPQSPPPAVQGNLRSRLSTFVGRESELRALRADMAASRLITLTGPGGSGKTRLAQEAAEAADAAAFPDGTWIAELAPLDHPAAVPGAVLTALGRRDAHVFAAAPEDPTDRLLEHCGRRRLLLVLDNCEHVIGAAAFLADALLASCPGLTILVTSREPLGVPGEAVRPVEPLPPPTAQRLFAERAAMVRTGFDLTPHAHAVEEICRRLDGLPLAIELAAARLRMLTPRQIADRLDDRFRLLTGGSRTLLPRQQTLRAVVDWSWDLLDEDERAALRDFSVFAGGCTLAAAEEVIGGPDTLQLLGRLIDKSLIVPQQKADDIRYRMLETIHEYAAERAADAPGDLLAATARHTAHYREFARTADSHMRGADQLLWADRVEAELDNIRAALHRTIEQRETDDATAIVLAMGWFWWVRSYRDEANAWLDRVIELGEPPEDPADPAFWPSMDLRMLDLFVKSDFATEEEFFNDETRAMGARIREAYGQHPGPRAARFPGLLWPFVGFIFRDYAGIPAAMEITTANCRAYGGPWELATALLFRTHIAVDTPGGIAHADADLPELLALSESTGDRWLRAQVHGARAEIHRVRGEYAAAQADLEAARRLGDELGARAEAPFLLARMGEVAHWAGDDAAAEKLLNEGLAEAERYGVHDARTHIRHGLSLIALRHGETARARELYVLAHSQAGLGTPGPELYIHMNALNACIIAAEGHPRRALPLLRAALSAGFDDGGLTEPQLAALAEQSAGLLLTLGAPAQAAHLHGAAHALRDGLPLPVPEAVELATAEARARGALGDAAYDAAWTAGRGMRERDELLALLELSALELSANGDG